MRRRRAQKRERHPDPVFNSDLLATVVNCIMESGKKSVAEGIVYSALEEFASTLKITKSSSEPRVANRRKLSVTSWDHTTKENVLAKFKEALDNARPSLEVRPRRVGGQTYPVPMEVAYPRGIMMAIRFVAKAARGRSEKGMASRLSAELLDALGKKGVAVKKCEEMLKMAKASAVFAVFRW